MGSVDTSDVRPGVRPDVRPDVRGRRPCRQRQKKNAEGPGGGSPPAKPVKGGFWGGFAPPAKNRGVWGAAPPSQNRKKKKNFFFIFRKVGLEKSVPGDGDSSTNFAGCSSERLTAYEAVDLITLYFCSCDSKAQGSENFACVFGPIVYQGGTRKTKKKKRG